MNDRLPPLRQYFHLTLLAGILTPGILAGQGDSIYLGDDPSLSRKPQRRFCGEENAAVGLLKGNVEVQFVVRADGTPDTATVLLLQASRLSASSGRSAARRLLASCMFRPGEINRRPVRTLTVQRVEFKELTVSVGNGRARPAYNSVQIQEPPARGRQDSVYIETDSLLEEKPTRFQCRNPVSLSSQQGLTTMDRLVWASRNGGNLKVSFVVLPNGTVDPTSFRRERGPAADLEDLLRQQALACVYLPGRIDGQVVRVRVFAYPGDIIFGTR